MFHNCMVRNKRNLINVMGLASFVRAVSFLYGMLVCRKFFVGYERMGYSDARNIQILLM